MSLINDVYAIHLAELLGPHGAATDIDYQEGICHFSIPLNVEQDFFPAINCAVCGISDGKLECMITDAELEQQLRFKKALMQLGLELKKQKLS